MASASADDRVRYLMREIMRRTAPAPVNASGDWTEPVLIEHAAIMTWSTMTDAQMLDIVLYAGCDPVPLDRVREAIAKPDCTWRLAFMNLMLDLLVADARKDPEMVAEETRRISTYDAHVTANC